MSVDELENELKKLLTMPLWGKKQNNEWDTLSNFIYQLPNFENLQSQLLLLNLGVEFNNYTIHRWFNTLSAIGIEKLFCENEKVIANKNKFNKQVDFSIKNIPFDHKTTVFPKGFNNTIEYAKQNPKQLITWLYKQQSKQGRYHTANRLFIILYKTNGSHWQLRKELTLIKPIISNYISHFNELQLHQFNFEKTHTTLADIIWVEM